MTDIVGRLASAAESLLADVGRPTAGRATLRSRAAAVGITALLVLAGAPSAGAVSCEWGVRFATDIVDYGERAIKSDDFLVSRRTSSDTRSIAVDAAREAKACGCPEAIKHLENVGRQALRAGNAQDLTAAQQYARTIKEYGQEALETLRKCPGN